MDPTTVVVAVAGIVGTLAGSLLGPLIAGRAQRVAFKEQLIMDRRLDAYVILLQTLRHLYENAQTWASTPLADLEEPDTEVLRSMEAEIRAVGSEGVMQQAVRVSGLFLRFNRELWPARLRHQRDRQADQADTLQTVAARMGLGGIVDEITRAVDDLEATIRDELKI